MDVADRIKKSQDWRPLVTQQPGNTKNAQIGQWAADIDVSASPGPTYEEKTSQQSSSVYSFPHNAVPANTRSTSGNSPFSSVSFSSHSPSDASLYREDRRQAFVPLINLSDGRSLPPCGNSWNANADMRYKDNNQIRGGEGLNAGLSPDAGPRAPLPSIHPSPQVQYPQSSIAATAAAAKPASTTSTAPKLASPSHIHRLTEPVSTRKRSKKEDIILLKASVVNDFKCPPWDKDPAPTDFSPQNGQDLFV